MGEACSTYGREKEVHTVFWWGSMRERDHLEGPGIDGRVILRCILRKWDGGWTGLFWLRIGTGDSHLETR
jgi:hypothetical protein